MRKIFIVFFAFLLVFSVSGCSYETRIDKASIAETVTVQRGEEGFVYSFFMLTDSDEPECVSIEASSFESACSMAEQEYIPDLSLANLEMFIVSDEVYEQILFKDIGYMSGQYAISPMVCAAVADEETLNFISEIKEAPEKIEKQIILLKNKNKDINISLLSIFNSFEDNKNSDLKISYINSEKELKAVPLSVSIEK